MIEEMIEDLTNLNDEEFADAIVEIATSLRELEIEFYRAVGNAILSGQVHEEVVKGLSGKRAVFFERAKLLSQYWEQVQPYYTKDKSLTDLIAIIKKDFLKQEKTRRRLLSKAILERRRAENLEKYQKTGNRVYQSKAEEDEEILSEA